MKLGIVIYTTDAETAWNAFRLGVFALDRGDSAKAFLLASGVEAGKLAAGKFVVAEQMQTFVDKGGKILACGTCLKVRNSEDSEMCPLSTMKDLYDMIAESDKVVSF